MLDDLIKQNGNEEIRLSDGRTLLMLAAAHGKTERVKSLLHKGAYVNATDAAHNWTALVYAIRKGNGETVQALIDHGADLTVKDKEGRTAIEHARKNGDAGIMRIVEGARR